MTTCTPDAPILPLVAVDSFDPATVLPWVPALPEVGDPILNERRAIIATLQQAAELEAQAAALCGKAFTAIRQLETRCGCLWTADDIEDAKRRAARVARP